MAEVSLITLSSQQMSCEALLDDATTGSVSLHSIEPLRARDEGIFIELVTREIGSRYPESGEENTLDLLDAVRRRKTARFGGSTISKVILGLYGTSGAMLGFTVATFKANQTVKFGPTVIVPKYRDHGIASRIRIAAEDVALKAGAFLAYSTCNASNVAARRYVMRAGYQLVAKLAVHCVDREDELVFAKRLAPSSVTGVTTPAILLPPVQRKRGDVVRVNLTQRAGSAQQDEIEQLLSFPLAKNARKLYVEASAETGTAKMLARFGFWQETGPLLFGTRGVFAVYGRTR